jgi:transposase
VAEEDVEDSQSEVAKRDRLWSRVQHLDGRPIGVREAAEKYDLSTGSLSRWIKCGYIRTLSNDRPRGRGKKRLLNEADVAYASLLANEHRRGREVFRAELIPEFAS